MKEEMERLQSDAAKDPELEEKLIAARDAGGLEELVKIAGEQGYQISLDDLQKPVLEEVDDEELTNVAGGGKEAPDGHDADCWTEWTWYTPSEYEAKFCPNGDPESNYRHYYDEFSELVYLPDKYYPGVKVYDKCRYCGRVYVKQEY